MGLEPTDDAIVTAVFALLDARVADATVCPSEVARRLVPDASGWRALMPRVREVAGRLVDQGRLRVTRRGVDVAATAGGGPIRLGRPQGAAPAVKPAVDRPGESSTPAAPPRRKPAAR